MPKETYIPKGGLITINGECLDGEQYCETHEILPSVANGWSGLMAQATKDVLTAIQDKNIWIDRVTLEVVDYPEQERNIEIEIKDYIK